MMNKVLYKIHKRNPVNPASKLVNLVKKPLCSLSSPGVIKVRLTMPRPCANLVGVLKTAKKRIKYVAMSEFTQLRPFRPQLKKV